MDDQYNKSGTLVLFPTVGDPLRLSVQVRCATCGAALKFQVDSSLPSPDLSQVTIKAELCEYCSDYKAAAWADV